MRRTAVVVLCIIMLLSFSVSVSAEEAESWEYILPIEYREVTRLKNGYVACDGNDKYALYDLGGEKISADYGFIDSFYKDDVTEAWGNGRYYVIDSNGKVLSEYDKRVFDVSELVLVNHTEENEDGRPFSYFQGEFGVYNYWGTLLTVLPYEKYMPSKNSPMKLTFEGGRLMYKENDKWGALNQAFQTAIEPLYDAIYPFYTEQGGITIAVKNQKYGLIDANGREITDFVYASMLMLYDGNGGLSGYKAENDGKYTVLDKQGNILLENIDEFVPLKLYDEYKLIEACIENDGADGAEGKCLYGVVDTNGKIVVPIENESIYHISDGMIPVKKADGCSGYYDLNGNAVTEFKYQSVNPFSEGLAFASSCIDGVWSHEVINKNGEVVFYTDSASYGGFYGGIAAVNGKVINKKGETVIQNPDWKELSGLSWWDCGKDGRFNVSDSQRKGVARYKGYASPWAEEALEKAATIGITEAEKVYDYTQSITREEFCELIYSYCTLDGPTAVFYTEKPFEDTNNEHITLLKAMGIIKGKSEAQLAPNDLLTREEAATIISRMIKNVHPDWAAHEVYFDFTDNNEISVWATDSIQRLCNMGIMNGVGGGRFAPQEVFTTEQAIATLVRCYEGFRANAVSGG